MPDRVRWWRRSGRGAGAKGRRAGLRRAAGAPTPERRTAGTRRGVGNQAGRIAEHWLESVGTSRSFLFLHLDEPHAPYLPPEKFAAYAPYDGEIAYADEIVGRLVKYLKSHQLYDRSTIVLLSDHG